MFDPRIYRAAFLPAVVAFVVMMFSLEPVPPALDTPVSTPTFDGVEAARIARAIDQLAPEPTPGSDADRAIAELVAERFSEIQGGQVSTQDFEATFEGEEVELRNVLLNLPGNGEGTLLIVAGRDAPDRAVAPSRAAATASLIAIAENLGGSRRERTIIFASTGGTANGFAGAEELVGELPDREAVEAAVVIAQPGLADPVSPFVIDSGLRPDSASAELVETARMITARQLGEPDSQPGPWSSLSRLAYPIGLGEQAVLRDGGLEAIAISGGGERSRVASAEEAISPETLGASGTALLTLVLTLDENEPAAAGPGNYIRLGDNLIPGWTVALLALALIAPALLAAGDTWLREQRVDWRARRTILWAIERALLPLAGMIAIYALALSGLLPDPASPYDPARFPPDSAALITAGLLLAALGIAGFLIRPMRTLLDSEPHTLAAAAGLVCGFALVGLWLRDPYLALLLIPAGHLWMLPARAAGPPRPGVIALLALVTLLPALAAFATVGEILELGIETPWHLLLLIGGGGIGLIDCLLWCLLLGGLTACVSAAGATPRLAADQGAAETVRGAGTHAGPGSLGSVPSSLPRL